MDKDSLRSLIDNHRYQILKMIDRPKTIDESKDNNLDKETNSQEKSHAQEVDLTKDEKLPESVIKFLEEDQKYGFLKIQASWSRQAIPVPNVKTFVNKTFGDYIHTFYTGFTNEVGIIDNIKLPCPDKSLSDKPSDILPYAVYDILTEHPDFYQPSPYQAIIFDGITSIQPVELVPKDINIPYTP